MSAPAESIERFDCFGSRCAVLVIGDAAARSARDAALDARRSLLEWHARFSRFIDDSELNRVNRDARPLVPVTPLMARLAQAVIDAGTLSGGLVDATLLDELESAGYAESLTGSLALADALTLAPARRPAAAGAEHWRAIGVDTDAGTLERPPGLRLDSGGVAKGLFADMLAERLAGHAGFAIDCAGDLAIGGRRGISRPVNVESPFDGSILHTFELRNGGVATSGIGRRSWRDASGRPAHHLLDPASGRPAFTGIVQATALAPSALLAEIRAKSAILSGPRQAARWLPDGGLIVLDDGSHVLFDPAPRVTLTQLSGFAQPRFRKAPEHA